MLRDYLRYFGFKIIIFLCHILPARFLYWIALRVADLNYFLFDPRGRESVKANLRRVLPDASEERIAYEARWVFRNFGKYLTEFFRFRSFDRRFFLKHVAICGREHIDAALAQGRGALIVSAHLSNWELGAAGLKVISGYPVNVVVMMHRYGKVNNLFVRERESVGVRMIDTLVASRPVYRALERNEIVCMLGDRDPTEQGIWIKFFGQPCRFAQGPARFAIRSGAPIIPAYALRRTNDSFTLYFLPPIIASDPSTWRGVTLEEAMYDPNPRRLAGKNTHPRPRDAQVRAIMQAYARVIEEVIRWHPEEWGVFYRVWEEEWQK